MRSFLTLFLMIGAGALVSVQLALNARLGDAVRSPPAAALISLTVGVLCLAPFIVGGAFGPLGPTGLRTAPLWAWLGGVCGAAYLTALAFGLPRLGAGVALACVIFGQLAAATIIDVWGLFGVPRSPPDLVSVFGLFMIAGGSALVAMKSMS